MILHKGRDILNEESVVSSDDIVVATLALKGGKGGFGSMLRAIGKYILILKL